jgi:hypothetical protein
MPGPPLGEPGLVYVEAKLREDLYEFMLVEEERNFLFVGVIHHKFTRRVNLDLDFIAFIIETKNEMIQGHRVGIHRKVLVHVCFPCWDRYVLMFTYVRTLCEEADGHDLRDERQHEP